MEGTPPTDTKTCKRARRVSGDSMTIEELPPYDQGYEADIEVLQPDKYEDVESDTEAEQTRTPSRRLRTDDEELVARMEQLGNDESSTDGRQTPLSMGSRKRRSLHADGRTRRKERCSGLEITEMADDRQGSPPSKKRRKNRPRNSVSKSSPLGSHSTTSPTPGIDETSTPDMQDVMDVT